MQTELQQVIQRINEKFNPVSIFLYGSRARDDFLEHSDYEVGVLYSRGRKISRIELKELNPHSNINIYPFEYESFLEGQLDTPFPEAIYLRELITGAKTVFGKEVVRGLRPPAIKVSDLLQGIVFNMGYALAAILSHRSGDEVTARIEFSKACLFGIRCLIILQNKKFPLSYDEIYESSLSVELGEYAEIVKHAIDVRKGAHIQELLIYKNISLLKSIKDKIVEVLEKEGDTITLS